MNVLDYLDKYWEKDLQYNENIWIVYSYPENNSCEEWAFDSMKKIIEKTTNNNDNIHFLLSGYSQIKKNSNLQKLWSKCQRYVEGIGIDDDNIFYYTSVYTFLKLF